MIWQLPLPCQKILCNIRQLPWLIKFFFILTTCFPCPHWHYRRAILKPVHVLNDWLATSRLVGPEPRPLEAESWGLTQSYSATLTNKISIKLTSFFVISTRYTSADFFFLSSSFTWLQWRQPTINTTHLNLKIYHKKDDIINESPRWKYAIGNAT